VYGPVLFHCGDTHIYQDERVFKIDSSSRVLPFSKVSTLGELAGGEFQWHGGVISKVNGAIYGFPAHADAVLKIQPETGEVSTIGDCRIEGFRCVLLVACVFLRVPLPSGKFARLKAESLARESACTA
jgi:hypothetical protein